MWRAYTGVIKKEFIHLIRDRNALRMLFVMPLVQILVLGYAINTDVKHLALDVYDADRSQLSRQITASLKAADYFVISDQETTKKQVPLWELEERFKSGRAEMALIIPNNFSQLLESGQSVSIGWLADGSDANAARIGIGYASQIVNRFASNITGLKSNIDLHSESLYNPEAESIYYMVPGIVATLVTALSLMLTAMAIVREREMGTLEQLLVTPIKTITLLLGKITAFTIVTMIIMGLSLAIAILWFRIPFVGSPFLLFGLSLMYLSTTLGVGMFFSTITSTQQQAMFLAWFFSVFTLLTSGYMTPIANMPGWVQEITLLNPMRYFMEIVRGIMMKGSNAIDLLPNIYALAILGVVIFGFSTLRFHKRIS